ncbi:MAG TPA: hypothetical protein VGL06_12710 [Pseudonocardiaceae bacterium]
MHATWARLAIVTALAGAVTAGSAMVTAAPASAATPIVVGSCATTVQGSPGTPVELSPSAVVQPITNLITAVPILGPLLAPQFQTAFTALPPIPLGALPTGSGVITGGQIANDVVAQLDKLPLLGPIIGTLVGTVQSTLASMCRVTMSGVNAVVAPVQDGTGALAQGSQQLQQSLGVAPKTGGSPGTGGTPGQTGTPAGGGGGQQQGGGSSGLPAPNSPVLGGLPFTGAGNSMFTNGNLFGFGFAESPLARYAGIPFASAGLFDPSPGVRYGGDVSGYAPGFGVLGQNQVPADGVQTAGQAEALGSPGNALTNSVGLPMLLAVLMLAGVTAALVRTWALRRLPG